MSKGKGEYGTNNLLDQKIGSNLQQLLGEHSGVQIQGSATQPKKVTITLIQYVTYFFFYKLNDFLQLGANG